MVYRVVILIFCIGTLSWAQTIQPSFSVMLSPGVAPCAIHVNATKFPLAAGTALTARYDWDFGDPHGRFNKLTGFVAAHLYDTAGQYTVTLNVTDETGYRQTSTAQLVVSPDQRRRIYVSNDGADENTGASPDAPVVTLQRAYKLMRDNSELLFRANQTYEVTAAFKIERQDVVLDRYGPGADPILLNHTPKGGPELAVQNQCNGVTIQHLTLDSGQTADPSGAAPKVGKDGIAARGRNLTVRGCTFLNLDNGINANGSPHGMLVQDCNAPLVTGLRAYLVWGQGSDLVYLGNFAANSTREHIVRMSGVSRTLVAYNDFTNLNRQKVDQDDYSKGTIEMHNGSWAYITHNTVKDGTIRVGPLGLNEPPTTATEWCVIDGNTLKNTFIPAYAGSHHIMIRNNVIYVERGKAFSIAGQDGGGRINDDITIANNTVINNSESGTFITVSGPAKNLVLANNLFAAPNLKPGKNGTAMVENAGDDLSDFLQISHNIWPAPPQEDAGVCLLAKRFVTAKQWLAMQPTVKDDVFATVNVDERGMPQVDSPALQARQVPGVLSDFDGVVRPMKGMCTIGAFQYPPPTTRP